MFRKCLWVTLSKSFIIISLSMKPVEAIVTTISGDHLSGIMGHFWWIDFFPPFKKQRNGSEFSVPLLRWWDRSFTKCVCCFYPLRNNKYHLWLSLIAPYCRSFRGFQLDSSRMARIEVACDATFALLSSASLWRLSLMLQEFNSSAIPAQGTRGGREKFWKPAAEKWQDVGTLTNREPIRRGQYLASGSTWLCQAADEAQRTELDFHCCHWILQHLLQHGQQLCFFERSLHGLWAVASRQ